MWPFWTIFKNYSPKVSEYVTGLNLNFTFLNCHWALQFSNSVVSDSSRPRGLQPTRPLCPWFLEGWYSNPTTLEQTHLPISFQVSPGCRRYSIKNQHEELTYLLQIQTVSTRCMNKKSITWRDQGIQLRIAIMWSSQQISLVFLMV